MLGVSKYTEESSKPCRFQRAPGMHRKNHPKGRLVALLSWLLRPAGLGSLLIVMGSLVADHVETRTSDSLAQAGDRAIVAMGRQLVESDLQAVGEQVLTLARLESIREATAYRPASEKRLARDFLAFARQRGVFEQIQLLTSDGKERVQVGLGAQGPYLVELQPSKERIGFRPAMARAPGELYVSSVDLGGPTRGPGHPPRAVVRFATPIVDEGFRKTGLLVVHYLAEPLLSRLRALSPDGRLTLLSEEGATLMDSQVSGGAATLADAIAGGAKGTPPPGGRSRTRSEVS